MKSEYFNKRSQSTQLRGHREKPKPKQINWDRTVYFVLLIVLLGLLAYYLFLNTFYVSGEGLVVTETVKVRAPEDIEVREQLVSKNSFIEKGEPLFRYSLMNWTGNLNEIEELEENIADEEEEIQEFQDNITLKRQAIQEFQDRIAYLEQERENFQEKIRLNAATSHELNEVENSLFSARSNLRQAQSELNVLVNNLNRRIQARENLEQKMQEFQTGEIKLQTYYSPVSGRVYDVSVRENQQAFRSDQIVSIKPTQADVYIFSVFEREDAEYIQPGTVMNIEFDNGEVSTGVIRSNYDARENLIDHYEQTGSLTTEYFVVEVVPPDSTTRAQWLDLDRSGLSIYRKIVGGTEVSPPGQNMNNSDAGVSSADRIDEGNNPGESESASLESNQSAISETAAPIDQESMEMATDEGRNEEAESDSPEYGLQGDTFHDELTGYSINLFTFEDKETATIAFNDIKKKGYRVDVQPVTIRKKDLWRVTVGQFRTKEDALAAAETLPGLKAENYFIKHIQ